MKSQSQNFKIKTESDKNDKIQAIKNELIGEKEKKQAFFSEKDEDMDKCLTDKIVMKMNEQLSAKDIFTVREDCQTMMKDEAFDKDEFGMAKSMLQHKKNYSVSKIQVDVMLGKIEAPTNFRLNKDFESHLKVFESCTNIKFQKEVLSGERKVKAKRYQEQCIPFQTK